MKRIAKILAAAAAGIALVSTTVLLASHAAEGDRREVESMNAAIRIEVGGTTFFADLEPNAAAEAFLKQLPMTVVMTELNGNEKYFEIPKRLPANAARPGRIHCGDLCCSERRRSSSSMRASRRLTPTRVWGGFATPKD